MRQISLNGRFGIRAEQHTWAVVSEWFITNKEIDLIEAVLKDFGLVGDLEALHDTLPPLVADHEIRLVRAR